MGWPEPQARRIGSCIVASTPLSCPANRMSSVLENGVAAAPASSSPIMPLIIPSAPTAATSRGLIRPCSTTERTAAYVASSMAGPSYSDTPGRGCSGWLSCLPEARASPAVSNSVALMKLEPMSRPIR
ncbi:MAG: hypothetical protein NT031_03960 [Planctomycetota bacterium]|nr:hypothetical protein [Planctomycetota bacterium]